METTIGRSLCRSGSRTLIEETCSFHWWPHLRLEARYRAEGNNRLIRLALERQIQTRSNLDFATTLARHRDRLALRYPGLISRCEFREVHEVRISTGFLGESWSHSA